jgi:hypothetical protein
MPELFNVHGFGPSVPVTGHAACPWVDHGVSGRTPPTTEAYASYAGFRLAFATAPRLHRLASPVTCTRRPIMQKVRRHPLLLLAIGLRPLVSVRFQVLFTRLIAVLLIVQSPYSSTIGHRGVFSLGRWSGLLHTGFHEPRATLENASTGAGPDAYGAITLCGGTFQTLVLRAGFFTPRRFLNPGTNAGLGCPASARRYSRDRCHFLLLRVQRCFSSPRSPPPPYAFGRG